MGEKPSTEYEKLVQEVYQALHDADYPGTVEVRHDVHLSGRSGCEHQIDVYWEVRSGDETFGVAVECKHLGRTVTIGTVRDFFGVLHDTGAKGIIVSQKGFQSGARKFATQYGIGLTEVRPPREQDWAGRVKGVVLQPTAVLPENVKMSFDLDEAWLVEKGFERSRLEDLLCSGGEARIVDGEGCVVVHDLREMVAGLSIKEVKAEKAVREFPGCFLEHPERGRVKIRAVTMTYEASSSTETFTVDGAEVVKAILKDVSTGEIKFLGEEGGIR